MNRNFDSILANRISVQNQKMRKGSEPAAGLRAGSNSASFPDVLIETMASVDDNSVNINLKEKRKNKDIENNELQMCVKSQITSHEE